MSERFLGKGTLRDISPGGWRVQGDHKVVPGLRLTLRLEVLGYVSPVEVERATVQWVRGGEFGIRIDKISREDAKRLAHLLLAARQELYSVKY
jgi:hypothetical protein